HPVAVLHAPGDHAQREKAVDLIAQHLLALELLTDRPQTLDAAVDRPDRQLRLVELRREAFPQLVDQALARAPLAVHLLAKRLVRRRLEVPERDLLELVLELAHAEAVRDRRVDVARLLRDAQPA